MMKLNKALAFTAVVLVFAVGVQSATADLVIDTFVTYQRLVADQGSPYVSGTVTGTGIIGGERDAIARWDYGDNEAEVIADLGVHGLLNLNTGAGTLGTGEVMWDGVDGDADTDDYTGLGGLDLTDGGALTAFEFNVAFDDLPTMVTMTVFSDALNYSSAALSLPGGILDPVDYLVPFTSFAADAGLGADFTNIGAIRLMIVPMYQSTDVQIDHIIVKVPEPNSALLATMALSGLVLIRRR